MKTIKKEELINLFNFAFNDEIDLLNENNESLMKKFCDILGKLKDPLNTEFDDIAIKQKYMRSDVMF